VFYTTAVRREEVPAPRTRNRTVGAGRAFRRGECQHLVLAYFVSKLQAELAVEAPKGWDRASEDTNLGALAVMSRNEQGDIETTKLGAHNTGEGAEIGVISGAVVGLLTGGLSIVGGAIRGEP
jgi:hypothetical protein